MTRTAWEHRTWFDALKPGDLVTVLVGRDVEVREVERRTKAHVYTSSHSRYRWQDGRRIGGGARIRPTTTEEVRQYRAWGRVRRARAEVQLAVTVSLSSEVLEQVADHLEAAVALLGGRT